MAYLYIVYAGVTKSENDRQRCFLLTENDRRYFRYKTTASAVSYCRKQPVVLPISKRPRALFLDCRKLPPVLLISKRPRCFFIDNQRCFEYPLQYRNSQNTARAVCCLQKMTDSASNIKTTAYPDSCLQKTTGGGRDTARYQKTTGQPAVLRISSSVSK